MSCSNSDDIINNSSLICAIENPIENLNWLKSEIDILEKEAYNYVKQAKYNDQTVFVFANYNPFINSVFLVKNCEGNNIGIIGNREQDIPFKILDEGVIIWKADNSECDL